MMMVNEVNELCGLNADACLTCERVKYMFLPETNC